MISRLTHPVPDALQTRCWQLPLSKWWKMAYCSMRRNPSRFGTPPGKLLAFPAGGQEALIHLGWSSRHLRGSWMLYP